MNRSRQLMFVGLEGVVVLGPVVVGGQLQLAPYARPFLHWASTKMRVGWLTRRSAREQLHVARQLALPDDAVALSSAFQSSPVEVFAREPAAIWVTATATPDEVDWGRRHLGSRFVEVDGRHGVRVEDKINIERMLRSGG